MAVALLDGGSAYIVGLQMALPPVQAVLAIDAQTCTAHRMVAALLARCVEVKEGQVGAGRGKPGSSWPRR